MEAFREPHFAYILVTFLFTSNTHFQDRHTHFYGTFAFFDVFWQAKHEGWLLISKSFTPFGPICSQLRLYICAIWENSLRTKLTDFTGFQRMASLLKGSVVPGLPNISCEVMLPELISFIVVFLRRSQQTLKFTGDNILSGQSSWKAHIFSMRSDNHENLCLSNWVRVILLLWGTKCSIPQVFLFINYVGVDCSKMQRKWSVFRCVGHLFVLDILTFFLFLEPSYFQLTVSQVKSIRPASDPVCVLPVRYLTLIQNWYKTQRHFPLGTQMEALTEYILMVLFVLVLKRVHFIATVSWIWKENIQ